MTHRWDAVIRPGAEMSLEWMVSEDREECNRVIINDLCNNPRPENNRARRYASYYPNRPGVIECVIGRWYFRYGVLNENTIEVFSIAISGDNPNHPMYRGPGA